MAAIRAERNAPRGEPKLRRLNLRRDLDAVLEFQYEIYEGNFPGFQVDGAFREDYSRDLRRAARDPNEIMFVMEQDRQLCGFIWGSLMSTLVDPRVGYIKNVYVAPHLRGTGAAQRLMRVVEQWLFDQGVEKIMLDASVVNERAVAFYRKMGYEVERVRMVKRPEPPEQLRS
ncbi:MAG: GNAT family N-acetyltransferase [Armatimonadota bacterium]|nr:GNAT family N-acetyltransferase [Armatimonadota bacterium]